MARRFPLNHELHLANVVVDSDRGRFNLHGHYAPRDNYAVDLVGGAVMRYNNARANSDV